MLHFSLEKRDLCISPYCHLKGKNKKINFPCIKLENLSNGSLLCRGALNYIMDSAFKGSFI